ncbi:hypothetical protein ACO0LL_13845 [Undibacterium sp. TC4M20W]|uniref:hypothetical protein n=1 Tax=Undibacterium sp. TC4M20W TaxID=3413052 RepID=UPI003BEF9199
MLKFFCSSLLVDINTSHFYISRQTAKLRRTTALEATAPVPFDIEQDINHFCANWKSVFASYPDRKLLLELIVDDVLVKYFVLAPPTQARSLKDLHAAAQMRLETLFGVPGDDWLISADWQGNQASLVCAVPKVLLEKIGVASKQSGQKILSLQPRFVWLWNQCKQRLAADGWFASVDEQAMTLAACQDGSLHMVTSILLPKDSDNTWLHTQLQRQAMLHHLTPPAQLLLAGRIPAAWQTSQLHRTHQYQIAKTDFANKITTAKASSVSMAEVAS